MGEGQLEKVVDGLVQVGEGGQSGADVVDGGGRRRRERRLEGVEEAFDKKGGGMRSGRQANGSKLEFRRKLRGKGSH